MEEEKRELVEMKSKSKGGAPLGNQNARTHGFYSNVLTKSERRSFATAVDLDGLDGEIALLRVKVRALVVNSPENVELITRAVNSLTRMVVARYALGQRDKSGLKQAIMDVLEGIVLPPGVEVGRILKR